MYGLIIVIVVTIRGYLGTLTWAGASLGKNFYTDHLQSRVQDVKQGRGIFLRIEGQARARQELNH